MSVGADGLRFCERHTDIGIEIMELPLCPSCGQSVLEDDATDCTFCGAAMDGSSGAKKPKAQPKKKKPAAEPKAETAAASADEDPFAIQQNPTTTKAVPCSPKPRRGRQQRVICPMCDSQGFIPKAALGRQVRCANKECLVPIFTAATEDTAETDARAPARISDEEAPVKPKKKKGGSAKSPILIYSVVGIVLLLGAVGLMMFLNQEGPDQLPPADIPLFTGEDDPEDDPNNGADTKPPEVVDHRAAAIAMLDAMIQTSRSNDNRNKPLTRRQTGDAFLRLNLPDKAAAEFAQMSKSRNRRM